MFKIHPWPFGYRVAFAVRDDDISYFTDPDMLTKIYDGIWDNIPISLSVIPYHKAINDNSIPPKFRNKNLVYCIDANENLNSFFQILEEGKADILQHGCTHENFGRKPEFCFWDYYTLRERLKRGKNLLEKTFNRRVKVFVPPHNRLSRAGCFSVISEKMAIARCCSYAEIFKTAATPNNISMLVKLFSSNPLIHRYPISPRLTLFKTHPEMQQSYMLASTSLKNNANNTVNEMKEGIHQAIIKEDLFYITVHYWDFYESWERLNWRMLKSFRNFLDFVRNQEGVLTTTLGKVADWCERLDSLIITRRGNNLKIKSRKDIYGLTISTTGKITFNGSLNEIKQNTFILNLKKDDALTLHLR